MTIAEYEFLLQEVQSPFLSSPLKENVYILKEDGSTADPEELSDNGHEESVTGDAEAAVQSRLQSVIPSEKVSNHLVEKGLALLFAGSGSQRADARSLAESFLFDLLNARPETAGLFMLNPKMPFTFGGRSAEIDLCSADLRIAIEIDGHHHFSDLSAYRRDRRKDMLLQREGYFVLRILAEDVVPQMHEVLESIIDIVRWRHASGHLSEVS